MQGVKIRNDLFSPNNVKCVEVNNFAPTGHQKNFINSLQNARHTLGCLERSIRKSNQYEQKLLHCKGSHGHSHDINEWWQSDQSEAKSFKSINSASTSNNSIKSSSSKGQADCADSWSTMSIVCLQYQYETLAKRYKVLLQAYDEQCHAASLRDRRLEHWKERAESTQEHLMHAYDSLLTVGEKYIALKKKKNKQKTWCEDQLSRMKQAHHNILEVAAHARMRFDARLSHCMANEKDSKAALLLHEIRKCNLLFLENMRLKALIEEVKPGDVIWRKC